MSAHVTQAHTTPQGSWLHHTRTLFVEVSSVGSRAEGQHVGACVRACLAVVQCGAGDDGPCILPWPRACPSLAPHPPTSQTPDDPHPETHPWLVPQPSFTMVPAACSRSHAPCGPVPDAASPTTSDDAGGDASAAPLAVGAVAWPTGRWRAAAGPVAGSGVFGGRA